MQKNSSQKNTIAIWTLCYKSLIDAVIIILSSLIRYQWFIFSFAALVTWHYQTHKTQAYDDNNDNTGDDFQDKSNDLPETPSNVTSSTTACDFGSIDKAIFIQITCMLVDTTISQPLQVWFALTDSCFASLVALIALLVKGAWLAMLFEEVTVFLNTDTFFQPWIECETWRMFSPTIEVTFAGHRLTMNWSHEQTDEQSQTCKESSHLLFDESTQLCSRNISCNNTHIEDTEIMQRSNMRRKRVILWKTIVYLTTCFHVFINNGQVIERNSKSSAGKTSLCPPTTGKKCHSLLMKFHQRT